MCGRLALLLFVLVGLGGVIGLWIENVYVLGLSVYLFPVAPRLPGLVPSALPP